MTEYTQLLQIRSETIWSKRKVFDRLHNVCAAEHCSEHWEQCTENIALSTATSHPIHWSHLSEDPWQSPLTELPLIAPRVSVWYHCVKKHIIWGILFNLLILATGTCGGWVWAVVPQGCWCKPGESGWFVRAGIGDETPGPSREHLHGSLQGLWASGWALGGPRNFGRIWGISWGSGEALGELREGLREL